MRDKMLRDGRNFTRITVQADHLIGQREVKLKQHSRLFT